MRGLRRAVLVAGALALGSSGDPAWSCANPFALGVSRVMQIDARAMPLVGSHDYGFTLPLAPGEIVLTFDDGPVAPYTNAVLKALAHECVRATFFMVGREANANPRLVRQIRAAGHTIGTHTQNHPLFRMPADRASWEINAGIASVGAALGTPRALAPFFRFPGLFRTAEAERYLHSRGLMSWSVDVDSYDWKRIGKDHMMQHTLADLEKRRGGILLMHDVQPKTALMLPSLLAQIKARGYRIVHVVPTGGGPLPAPVAAAPPPAPTAQPAVQAMEPAVESMQPAVRNMPPDSRTAGPVPRETVPPRGAFAPQPPRGARHPANPGGNGLFEAIFSSSVGTR